MEALQGYKDGCSAASAGVGDIGEQLYWGHDCKLDFKQFVEAIFVLCHPFLKSVSGGPQQENRLYEDLLYNLIGKPEFFWYIPSY